MTWLVVNGNGDELIFEVKPKRSRYGQWWELPRRYLGYPFLDLKKGTIEKIVGRKMTWEDEPVRT